MRTARAGKQSCSWQGGPPKCMKACGVVPQKAGRTSSPLCLRGTIAELTPSNTPALQMVRVNGLELAVWEWPGRDPALVFAHATGFHGRCWDQIARQFPEHRRVAVDFRGHGRSSKPEPPYLWPEIAGDLAAILDQRNIRAGIGIGHSMGGHSVVAAA